MAAPLRNSATSTPPPPSAPTASPFPQYGNDNVASAVDTGGVDDVARAGGFSDTVLGSNDIASVLGSDSTAIAGADATTAGDSDLAAVFGDMLNALATGGNFLTDILPSL